MSKILKELKKYSNRSSLRFITCGSVDDGKSTLIGRLLYDSKLLLEDQLATLEKESKLSTNTADGEFDFSLLVDGLQAEREQGITIDVAYRFFSTDKRRFIVADTPGHEQFTRNMATGASNSDLAILLVDARKGILKQTKRHTFINKLLGIKDFIVAINKIDLIGYDEERYNDIKKSYLDFLGSLGLDERNVHFIPLSGLKGDNITELSSNTSWYKGKSLLDLLETIVPVKANIGELRFITKYINRSGLDFRGFSGQVVSGEIKKGDEIRIYPSGVETKVKEIIHYDGNQESAVAGEVICIQTTDEVEISSDTIITHTDNTLKAAKNIEADIIWMDDIELHPNRNYLIKFNNKGVNGKINIKHKININTLEKIADERKAKLNDIFVGDVELDSIICSDEYENLKATGSFIIIDKFTNMTSGAGMVTKFYNRKKHSDNIYEYKTKITKLERKLQKRQEPKVLWFTGLSGSGKSTISNILEEKLYEENYHTYLLDGDNVRKGLNADLSFNVEERSENIRRISEVAKLMNDAGLICITSFISPFKKDRDLAKSVIGEDNFVEIYIKTSLEECKRRDVKGLYKKAENGEIRDFTGIGSPYEEPEDPSLIIDTQKLTAIEGAQSILVFLKDNKML